MKKTNSELLTNAMSYYINLVRENPPMSHEEEIDKFTRFKKGEIQLFDYLVKHNIALVLSVAKRYVNKGLDFDDLIQEGNLGLIKAVKKFDVDRKCKFSTYAIWWIRQPIVRSLSRTAQHKFVFIEDITYILSEYKIFDSDINVGYLDYYINDLQSDLKKKLGFKRFEVDPIDVVDHEKFQDQIRELMVKELDEKEFLIVTKRYLETEKIPLRQLGKLFPEKFCGETIRQIERKAFKKMRENSSIRKLLENHCGI